MAVDYTLSYNALGTIMHLCDSCTISAKMSKQAKHSTTECSIENVRNYYIFLFLVIPFSLINVCYYKWIEMSVSWNIIKFFCLHFEIFRRNRQKCSSCSCIGNENQLKFHSVIYSEWYYLYIFKISNFQYFLNLLFTFISV